MNEEEKELLTKINDKLTVLLAYVYYDLADKQDFTDFSIRMKAVYKLDDVLSKYNKKYGVEE